MRFYAGNSTATLASTSLASTGAPETLISSRIDNTESTNSHEWDINAPYLPTVVPHVDVFNPWPDGPTKTVYHGDVEKAQRHFSGWAMRNTNNHNSLVLKKSCVGVMICDRMCTLPDGSHVTLRPGICTKALRKQLGKPCPNPRCCGQILLIPCKGQAGYPVTHFWRTVEETGLVFFQSKGYHDHPRPDQKPSRGGKKFKVKNIHSAINNSECNSRPLYFEGFGLTNSSQASSLTTALKKERNAELPPPVPRLDNNFVELPQMKSFFANPTPDLALFRGECRPLYSSRSSQIFPTAKIPHSKMEPAHGQPFHDLLSRPADHSLSYSHPCLHPHFLRANNFRTGSAIGESWFSSSSNNPPNYLYTQNFSKELFSQHSFVEYFSANHDYYNASRISSFVPPTGELPFFQSDSALSNADAVTASDCFLVPPQTDNNLVTNAFKDESFHSYAQMLEHSGITPSRSSFLVDSLEATACSNVPRNIFLNSLKSFTEGDNYLTKSNFTKVHTVNQSTFSFNPRQPSSSHPPCYSHNQQPQGVIKDCDIDQALPAFSLSLPSVLQHSSSSSTSSGGEITAPGAPYNSNTFQCFSLMSSNYESVGEYNGRETSRQSPRILTEPFKEAAKETQQSPPQTNSATPQSHALSCTDIDCITKVAHSHHLFTSF